MPKVHNFNIITKTMLVDRYFKPNISSRVGNSFTIHLPISHHFFVLTTRSFNDTLHFVDNIKGYHNGDLIY